MGTQKVKKIAIAPPSTEAPAGQAGTRKEPVSPKVKRAGKPKQRGRNYTTAAALVEKGKLYPLEEALDLVKKTSYAHFDATVEAHFNLTKKPKEIKIKGVSLHLESKTPLLHATLGKVSDKNQKLADNFKTLFQRLQSFKPQKVVLTSTMGPGVKVDPTSV